MADIQFQPYVPDQLAEESSRVSSLDVRLTRTNYFDGRLLKASDLTRDQIYLDERVRELGRIVGSGIAHGLTAELVAEQTLRVRPGLAVAQSGRVLELNQDLEVNLQDRAFIIQLNQGYYRRFRRGLYAVALQYAEIGTDSTEVYPADLASERKSHFNSFTEGVELILVPLRIPLPQADHLSARASLVRDLISFDQQLQDVPDDAVALGLLAFAQDKPAWLDLGLLRRPLRAPVASGALQQDLAAHYNELLKAVSQVRNDAGLNGNFPAAQYFRLLPPLGPIPKDALDPVHGRQGYFPSGYEVAIAPVRRGDIAALLEESRRLPAIDLEHDVDADVLVLVPMSDTDFALRGRQLETDSETVGESVFPRLPFINPLRLRLRPLPAPHRLDTDAKVWEAIWGSVPGDELLFVRRPPRAAETGVKAVVLARGFALPEPGEDPEADLTELRRQLGSAQEEIGHLRTQVEQMQPTESTLGLYRKALDIRNLLKLRGVKDEGSLKAAEKLTEMLKDNDKLLLGLVQILMLVPRSNDTALWISLPELAAKALFPDFLKIAVATPEAKLPSVVLEAAQDLGLSDAAITAWKNLLA